jgi:hypothetical protein
MASSAADVSGWPNQSYDRRISGKRTALIDHPAHVALGRG